jgi:hypothetical protein
MLHKASRRTYILALAATVGISALLLLHYHVDKLPFGPAEIWEESSPELSPAQGRLNAICHSPDPFDAEYGRTNIRMTRAYEGKRITAPVC